MKDEPRCTHLLGDRPFYTGYTTYNSILRTQMNEFLKSELKARGYNEIKPSFGTILSMLYRAGGCIQIKTIYDTVLKQKSTVTEIINRLVKLGYVEKIACSEDKRVTYIRATEKALAFENDFNEISDKLRDRVFEGFTEEEKQLLAKLTIKAIKNFT